MHCPAQSKPKSRDVDAAFQAPCKRSCSLSFIGSSGCKIACIVTTKVTTKFHGADMARAKVIPLSYAERGICWSGRPDLNGPLPEPHFSVGCHQTPVSGYRHLSLEVD